MGISKMEEYLLKEEKLDKRHLRIVMALMIIWILHYILLDLETIGVGENYSIYIFYIPVSLGIIALGFYRKPMLLNNLRIKESFRAKLIFLSSMFFQGLLFSYLSFGTLAHGIWNQLNSILSESNRTEYITVPVKKFSFPHKGRNQISFYVDGESEFINVQFQSIKKYRDSDPRNYAIELKVNKGFWESYVVNGWKIRPNDSTN